MAMAMRNRFALFLLHSLFCLLLRNNTCYCVESDIRCLETLKTQLEDPNNHLSSWDFSNKSAAEGFICKFDGIECWHPDESKVLNIRLSNMGLLGQLPSGLKNCTSLTGLDLSDNNLSGSLPVNIDEIIPFVTTLDLSSNNFSGNLPSELGNLTHLNALNLQRNQFSGKVPWQLGQLNRLATFNAANNCLSGELPGFSAKSTLAVTIANQHLCGGDQSAINSRMIKLIIFSGVGGSVVGILFVSLFIIYCRRGNKNKDKIVTKEDIEGKHWVISPKERDGVIKLRMCENWVTKMRLHELRKATNNFCDNNIIDSGIRGNLYEATLSNGSLVAVMRLSDTQQSRREFLTELTTLGRVKHPNVVSLQGFCVARKERLLVYEYMPKKTLYQQLHQTKANTKFKGWPLRLRIALGVARGLAWLHHNCNPCIVHCNISSKCVVLDLDVEPKITDFRYAKLMNHRDDHLTTIVNIPHSNMGYVAPEYTRLLVATQKGDVYSFGVLFLELITGKVPIQEVNPPQNFNQNLVEWIVHLKINSLLLNAVDESLSWVSRDDDLLECLKIASACVASVPEERPSMLLVYQQIREIGIRYGFEADDEIPTPTNNINNHASNSIDRIESNEICEIHEMQE